MIIVGNYNLLTEILHLTGVKDCVKLKSFGFEGVETIALVFVLKNWTNFCLEYEGKNKTLKMCPLTGWLVKKLKTNENCWNQWW